jgi:hypothetical protein
MNANPYYFKGFWSAGPACRLEGEASVLAHVLQVRDEQLYAHLSRAGVPLEQVSFDTVLGLF